MQGEDAAGGVPGIPLKEKREAAIAPGAAAPDATNPELAVRPFQQAPQIGALPAGLDI